MGERQVRWERMVRNWILVAMVAGISGVARGAVEVIPLAFPGMRVDVDGETIVSVPSGAFEIDRFGQVMLAFESAGGASSTGQRGLWLYDHGRGLQLVGKPGRSGTGLPAEVEFTGFDGEFEIGDGGHIAFVATDTGSPQPALWAGRPGDLRVVARMGELAPGLGGRFYDAPIEYVQLNSSGGILFHQGNVSTDGRRAAWYEGPSDAQPQLIAADGMAAPGTAEDFAAVVPPFVSETGGAAFFALTNIPEGTGGIWRWDGQNGLRLVAARGVPAPATGGEEFLRSFQPPRMAGNGTMVFAGATRNPQTGEGGYGLWVDNDARGLHRVHHVPRRSDRGAIAQPEVSSDGKIVFGKREWGRELPVESLWVVDGGNVSMVVGPEEFESVCCPHAINAQGRVVFEAYDHEGRSGFWTIGPDGVRERIIREGDTIELGGEAKTVDLLRATRSSLSDNDRFVFQVVFTDDTTATMVAVVPEPSCVAWVGWMLGMVGMRRIRHVVLFN